MCVRVYITVHMPPCVCEEGTQRCICLPVCVRGRQCKTLPCATVLSVAGLWAIRAYFPVSLLGILSRFTVGHPVPPPSPVSLLVDTWAHSRLIPLNVLKLIIPSRTNVPAENVRNVQNVHNPRVYSRDTRLFLTQNKPYPLQEPR